MSRKSKIKTTTPAFWKRLTARTLAVLIAGAVLVLAAGVIFADWYTCLPPETHAQYVGRQSCVACHQQQAKLFADSHHDKAMDIATDATVLGDFNNATLEHFGSTSRMYRDGERFMIHTEGPDGKPGDFEVKYVFGVAPLQNYMVEFDRPANMPANEISRLQVLRVTWDCTDKKWFYLNPPDVYDKLAPDDDLHWTGIAQRWNTMCADCHSTNVMKNFNAESLRYHTTFSEIDVSCEACHGPGSTHVALANKTSLFWDRKLGKGLTVTMKGASPDAQLQVCATCHARRELLAAGYQPGDNYADHYATELLSRLTYHADGQIEDEDFEHGSFLQSKMYHKDIRCTDCHDPHSAKPKHEGNKLCTSCHQHPAGKYDSPLHHHHQEGGKGASCVACHMPTTTYMDVHVRHDHSLRVPRPDLSVELSTPNACTACHLDQKKLKEAVKTADPTAKTDQLKQYLNFLQAARTGNATIKAELSRLDQWSAEATKKWYGEKPDRKPEPQHFAFALTAARNGDLKANELLADVVRNRTWPAIVRATALTEWQQYGSPEMLAASITSLQDPNPLVRAAAAGNLVFAPPEERIAALVPLLKDPDFIVRRVAGRTLVDVARAMTPHDRGELNAVLIAWTDGLLANNDRGGVYLAIGSLQQQRNGPTAGEAMYREAIRVEPNLVGARANLAATLEAKLEDPQLPAEQRSQLQQEIAGLRAAEFELIARDARLAPENASVQYRYGLALYLRGEMPAALAAIEKAVALSPRVTEFRLSYALLLQKEKRVAEAIEQVETILRQTPNDAEVQQLLRELREQ